MVIGSVLTPFESTIQFEAALNEALDSCGHSGGELKWEKVRKHNLGIYRAFVARLFDELERNRACFNAIVLDRGKLKHQKYNAGSGELGFNKFVYQHLLKYARLFPDGNFYVFPDYRATHHVPEELRKILNAGALARYGMIDPYRVVQFKNSKDSRIIQAVDVVIGCIGYALNERGNREGAAPSKRTLARCIQSRTSLVPPFDVSTPAWKKAFNIWHFRLSE